MSFLHLNIKIKYFCFVKIFGEGSFNAAHKSQALTSKLYHIPLLELASPKDFMGESTTCAMLQADVIYSLLVLINLCQLLLFQSSYPTEVAKKTPVLQK